MSMWKEVIQKFKGEPLVLPEPTNKTDDVQEFLAQGKRPFYFYLHGRAAELNDFDICHFNDIAMLKSLSNFATLCYIVWYDGIVAEGCTVERGIILKNFNGRRMEGWICLLSDHEGISEGINRFYSNHGRIEMYYDDEQYLLNENRYVHSLLFRNDYCLTN